MPVPATVVICPVALSTRRIRWLSVSATNTFPEASTATPPGKLKVARVANSPSPPNMYQPLPATVSMVPPVSTRRTRMNPVSAM